MGDEIARRMCAFQRDAKMDKNKSTCFWNCVTSAAPQIFDGLMQVRKINEGLSGCDEGSDWKGACLWFSIKIPYGFYCTQGT